MKLTKKKEDTITNIKNKRQTITTFLQKQKRISWTWNANKLDNLDEMDKFMNKLTKQIQEETEILNRPMIRDWISIKQSSYKERPGPHGFTSEVYWIFKEKLTPILHKLFQKNRRGGKISQSIIQGQYYFDAWIRC